jgi:hypothetical protein
MTTRRRKTPKLKRRKEATAARRHRSSAADLQKKLDQRTRELTEAQKHLAEALEQQTATSEVLQVISTSPGELDQVFTAVLKIARFGKFEHAFVGRRPANIQHGPPAQAVSSPLSDEGRKR